GARGVGADGAPGRTADGGRSTRCAAAACAGPGDRLHPGRGSHHPARDRLEPADRLRDRDYLRRDVSRACRSDSRNGRLSMHLHILGICGTFMGGIAALARASGHKVTGCDRNVYPPMSTQLAALGIDLIEGYEADQLALEPDVFVIATAL